MAIGFEARTIAGREKNVFLVSDAAGSVGDRVILEETLLPVDVEFLNMVDAQNDELLGTFDQKLANFTLPNGINAAVFFFNRIFDVNVLTALYEDQDRKRNTAEAVKTVSDALAALTLRVEALES